MKIKINDVNVIKYGFLNNCDYVNYLINKEKDIIKRIPWRSFKAKMKELKNLKELKKAISSMK